ALPLSRRNIGSLPTRPAVHCPKKAAPSCVSTTWRGLPDLLFRIASVPASALKSQTSKNSPYGMIGGIEETSASFEAPSSPQSYPTGVFAAVHWSVADPLRSATGSWQRIGGESPPRRRSSQPPRPRVMHEVLPARAAVKRSQGRPRAKY